MDEYAVYFAEKNKSDGEDIYIYNYHTHLWDAK